MKEVLERVSSETEKLVAQHGSQTNIPRRAQTGILEALMKDSTVSQDEDALDNEMVLNMGPQHPATHGVLRVLLRLDGETVINAECELGYLHRGYEKLAENMTYHEYIPHTDRLDYISPLANNTA
jgi:NADH-quinone oxidoreductase subunit D